MAETAVEDRAHPGGVRKRAVVAAVMGNFIEWYDFTIYGYLAVVIAPLFFPSEDAWSRSWRPSRSSGWRS